MDLFLRYWAVSGYVGQYDAYPYRSPGDDCHVYDDPTTGQLKFIPHGADETWYDKDRVVYDGAAGVMAAGCVAVPECFAAYQTHVFEVLQLAEDIDLLGYFDIVRAQIELVGQADTHKAYSDETVEDYRDAMREMIRLRRTDVSPMFD
jgi:hypothetical protein